MRVSKLFLTFASLAALSLATACEQASPVSPSTDGVPGITPAVTFPTSDLNEVVWVCKDAPSGSFDFTVSYTINPAVSSAPPPNIINAAPTIAAGTCTKVASAGNGHFIVVTELPASGFTFNRVEKFYTPLFSTSLVSSGTEYDPTVSETFGDLGRLYVFYNDAVPTGEGCTPGYWRNHFEDWPPTGYSPSDDFDTTFGTDLFSPDITLGEAIWMGGGGVKKVARHGTAALLSAAHPDVDYPVTVAEVIAAVQAGDVDMLVTYNELGCDIP